MTTDQIEYNRRLQAQIDDAAETYRLINGERPGGEPEPEEKRSFAINCGAFILTRKQADEGGWVWEKGKELA